MTNEEKAIETYRTRYLKGEEREIMRERRKGFVAGANWKDQQFKEYLEKKKTEMLDKRRKGEGGVDTYYKRRMVEEIINELFNNE